MAGFVLQRGHRCFQRISNLRTTVTHNRRPSNGTARAISEPINASTPGSIRMHLTVSLELHRPSTSLPCVVWRGEAGEVETLQSWRRSHFQEVAPFVVLAAAVPTHVQNVHLGRDRFATRTVLRRAAVPPADDQETE